MSKVDLRNGDSREVLKTLAENSVDSIVCDPPYDLTSIVKRFGGANAAECQQSTDGRFQRLSKGFMGQEWDGTGIAFDPAFWAECMRVLKPGGHLLAFGGTRTYHRMATAIEDAGFDVRDMLAWHYATGFPKSHDVSKGIDDLHGAEREVVGQAKTNKGDSGIQTYAALGAFRQSSVVDITAPATPEAAKWNGWGSALKPATEPICVARKPLSEASIARNVLRWETGAINVEGCRIGDTVETWPKTRSYAPGQKQPNHIGTTQPTGDSPAGRWPANLIFTCICPGDNHLPGCPVNDLDNQSGLTRSGFMAAGTERANVGGWAGPMPSSTGAATYGDEGGASRFFFVAKPSRRERGESNIHPTVKPVTLLRYLQRLVTPPGGVTLDPFMGSGTAGIAAQLESFQYIGIERDPAYFRIAQQRTGHWTEYDELPEATRKASAQMSMFDLMGDAA